MKKDIKFAAIVEFEAQTLETDKAASAAHDAQGDPLFRQPLFSSKESVTILKERKPSKLTSGKAKSFCWKILLEQGL